MQLENCPHEIRLASHHHTNASCDTIVAGDVDLDRDLDLVALGRSGGLWINDLSSVAIHWRSLHPLCYRHPVVTTLLQRLEAERRERREELRQAVRAGLRDALRELLPQTPVRLFGSITQPYRFNEHSDVDLALETEAPGLSIYQLISLLSERVERRVDVLLLPECRFRDKILAEGELWTPPH